MPRSSNLPYDELVYHLDLCILTYALYSQTLIWPFDPYYEHMALKGSSRRDNTMAAVRTWATNNAYRGPGSTRGWATNNSHDPIICRYDRVKPWLPAICLPEGEWLFYQVPTEISGRIASVRVCEYTGGTDPNGLAGTPQLGAAVPKPNPAGGAADILYCFEGGTGGQPGAAACWSLMGLVLERHKAGGHYDVHVAFRGSRSGSGGRALVKGAFQGTGNPDWVTDMDFASMVQDPVFSTYGSVSRGFSHAVKTCLPNIIACFQAVQANHGVVPPDNIWVTGHSLGGALATHFASAMIVGHVYGPNGQGASMPLAVRTWPWDRTKLITVSAPKNGGKSFHRNFNSKVYCRRVVLSADPITKDPPRITAGRHAVTRLDLHHVGMEVYVSAETTVGHAALGAIGLAFGDHEPKAIRERLIRKLAQWGDVAPAAPPYVHDPWMVYPNFNAMSGHAAMTDATIHTLLNGIDAEIVHYLTAFATVMGTNSAYKTFIRAATALDRTTAVVTAATRIGVTVGQTAIPARTALIKTVTDVRVPYDDIGKYIGMVLILAELGRNPALTLGSFGGAAALIGCLQ